MAQRCWSAPDPLPPVYLCLAVPLRHCPFDSLLHSPTEPSFCSFCEQKQRISGAVAHCSTWNTVHFVNRSSEAMEQRPSVSRSIPPCMRVWIGALRPAPLHRCALNRCAIRAPQAMTERAAHTRHIIKPLRRCDYAFSLYSAPALRCFGSDRLYRTGRGIKCSKLELRQKTLILSRLQ